MASDTVRRTVKHRVRVADDLEVHMSNLTVAGEHFVEIRNYVPSLKEYGRGITVPAALHDEVHKGFHKVGPSAKVTSR